MKKLLLSLFLPMGALAQPTFTPVTIPAHTQNEHHGVAISNTANVNVLLTDHSRNGHKIFSWNGTSLDAPSEISPGTGALRATGTTYGFIIDDLSGQFGAAAFDENGSFLGFPCAPSGATQFTASRGEINAFGDFDGDGSDDCAASDGSIYSWPARTLLASGLGRGYAVGQYAGGPELDLFTATGVYIQQPDGTFTLMAAQPGIVGDLFTAVSLDFDGDGDSDLVQGPGGGTVQVWRNDGTSWTNVSAGSGINITHTNFPYGNYHELLTTDIDNDGCDDYLNSFDYRVMLSNCDGTFTLTHTLDSYVPGPATAKVSATFGDLDGDGDDDVCWSQAGLLECALIEANSAPPPPAPIAGAVPPIVEGTRHLFANKQLFGPMDYINQRTLALNDLNTWMYDRVQALYEYYLTTGDETVHTEALASAQEYALHYDRAGGNAGFPGCRGGWSFAGVNKCDRKFTYGSALWYAYVIDGVVLFDPELLEDLRAYAMGPAWEAAQLLDDVGDRISFPTTERNMGYSLMLLGHVEALARRAAVGIPADSVEYLNVANTARQNIEDSIEWFFDWQADDVWGCWAHSYRAHETIGTPYGGPDDDITCSPWQSGILTGAMLRIWFVNNIKQQTCGPQNDQWCIPIMLVKFAQFLEDYAYFDDSYARVPFDGRTGIIQVNDTVTFGGGTVGIIEAADVGSTGQLIVTVQSGSSPSDNETITTSSGGAALVNGTTLRPGSWRHPWDDSDQMARYLSLPLDLLREGSVQNNEGFNVNVHNPETQCQTALGYHFSDLGGATAAQKQAFLNRYNTMQAFYNLRAGNDDMASLTNPTRMFAWQHAHFASCEWLVQ